MIREDLSILLGKLEDYWRSTKAPILNKLNPGISYKTDTIKGFTGILPSEVWELYQWKNGVKPAAGDTIGELKIIEMGIFDSFEHAQQLQQEMANDPYGWDSSKFILFESGGGDYYLIDAGIDSPSYGQIFYHSVGSPEFNRIISIYDSLYALFQTTYECFANNIYEYRSGKWKCNDINKEIDIAKALNPKSDYWRLGES